MNSCAGSKAKATNAAGAMDNPRRSNGHRRNMLRARVLSEENTCGICGEPVDKTLTMAWGQHSTRCVNEACPGCVPHPMRAEVDEIVPVSRGGNPYDRTNCRLAHRICNQRRGAGDPKPEPTRHDSFPITIEW